MCVCVGARCAAAERLSADCIGPCVVGLDPSDPQQQQPGLEAAQLLPYEPSRVQYWPEAARPAPRPREKGEAVHGLCLRAWLAQITASEWARLLKRARRHVWTRTQRWDEGRSDSGTAPYDVSEESASSKGSELKLKLLTWCRCRRGVVQTKDRQTGSSIPSHPIAHRLGIPRYRGSPMRAGGPGEGRGQFSDSHRPGTVAGGRRRTRTASLYQPPCPPVPVNGPC